MPVGSSSPLARVLAREAGQEVAWKGPAARACRVCLGLG